MASPTDSPDSERTTLVPAVCSARLTTLNSATRPVCRSPTTMSASPASTGATRAGMHDESYWLSASVLTMTSAPRRSDSSIP